MLDELWLLWIKVREFTNEQDKQITTVLNRYRSRPNVKNDIALMRKSEEQVFQIREMVLQHLKYEKNGMSDRVRDEHDSLTADEKFLYQIIKENEHLRVPNLRGKFIRAIDEESIMKQVMIDSYSDKPYSKRA